MELYHNLLPRFRSEESLASSVGANVAGYANVGKAAADSGAYYNDGPGSLTTKF